jgi:hypothetical protein
VALLRNWGLFSFHENRRIICTFIDTMQRLFLLEIGNLYLILSTDMDRRL